MKKIALLCSVFTLLIFQSSFQHTSAAAFVQYPNEVNVSVHLAETVTLVANGNYQLINKDSNASTNIPAGTTITAKKNSANITITFTGFSQNAVKGFDIKEITGTGTQLMRVSNGVQYRGSFFIKPNGTKIEIINFLDMEDYLKGVVPSEMPASWHKEALKAQAISARSYAANTMMLTSTAASQVYKGFTGEDSRSNQAIAETAGVVVKYNGKPIQTFFFSTSGGKTANVGDVWNSDQRNFPYLVSVDDPYEVSPYSNWSETFTSAQLLSAFGLPSTAIIYDITFSKKGANGEIGSVTVKTSAGDKTVSGNESVIRKLFPLPNANVYNQLYSNWFTATVNGSTSALTVQTTTGTSTIENIAGQKVRTASGEITLTDTNVTIQTASGTVTNKGEGVTSVTLSGKGWGHRIGMSQYGAKGFAEKGWTAERILTHYFKGTVVSK